MRVLQYADVRSERIDVDAQRSLLRMSRNPATSADAAGMADAVRDGSLLGIYAVNRQAPAMRAKKMGIGWWQLIPQGRDSILFLDSGQVIQEPPLIAFRHDIGNAPQRVDAALRTVWQTYQFFRAGQVVLCGATPGSTPVAGVVPPVLCQVPQGSRCRSDEVTIWMNAFIPNTGPGIRPVPDGSGRMMLDTNEGDCFLSDGRDFSSVLDASGMVRSRVALSLRGGMIHQHSIGPITTVNRATGRVTCLAEERFLNRGEIRVERLDRPGGVVHVSIVGRIVPPCMERFTERARATFAIQFGVHLSLRMVGKSNGPDVVEITTDGFVGSLPAYEAYARVSSAGMAVLFALPHSGTMATSALRPINALGRTNVKEIPCDSSGVVIPSTSSAARGAVTRAPVSRFARG